MKLSSLLAVWNSGATVFEGIKLDVTDTASAAASNLLNLLVGGTTKFAVNKDGLVDLPGGGIKFPAVQVASADANTLDDYEEGTFTPALAFGGASTGITYSSRAGRYTKVGRLVFIDIYILLSAKGSSTGSATITGLPFTNNASTKSVCQLSCNNMTGLADAFGRVVTSTTAVSLRNNNTGASSALTEANFANNSEVELSLVLSV